MYSPFGRTGYGGTASFNTTTLSKGSHSITAVYSGNGTFSGSTSQSITVNVLGTSSTTIASSANPSFFGQTVIFTATVTGGSNGEAVTFYDGGTTLGTGSLSGGLATYATSVLALGGHSITASYGGDANYSGSTSAVLAQTVNQSASTTSLSSNSNPSTYGSAVTFTATVAGGGDGEIVTFMEGSTALGTGTLASGATIFTISALAGGSHSITAVYGGDTNYAGSTSGVLTQVVDPITTTISVASNNNPSTYSSSVTFTAAITGPPNGETVTFKDGAVTLGTGILDSGSTQFTTSSLGVGSHSITAVYGGDSTYSSATSAPLTQTVGDRPVSINVISSENPSVFGDTITLTFTFIGPGAIPTGTATISDGAAQLATTPLDVNGQITYTTSAFVAGKHTIYVVYNGDPNYY